MYRLTKNLGLHDWIKVAKVDSKNKADSHVKYFCNGCGLQAIELLSEPGLLRVEKGTRWEVIGCRNPRPFKFPKRIRVIFCEVASTNPQFKHMTPGSVHKVITPPSHHLNDENGLWVQGYGNQVKLLTGEFEPWRLNGSSKPKFKRNNKLKKSKFSRRK